MSNENDEIAAIRARFEAAIYKAYGKPELTMSTTNDEQGYYSKGIDPDGIIPAAIKRKEAEDPRLRKGEQFFTMNTPAERAPMLSEKDWPNMIYAQASEHGLRPGELSAHDGMEIACDYYESLITKGVLRVAKKVDLIEDDEPDIDGKMCPDCRWKMDMFEVVEAKFCPGCGAEIVKP